MCTVHHLGHLSYIALHVTVSTAIYRFSEAFSWLENTCSQSQQNVLIPNSQWHNTHIYMGKYALLYKYGATCLYLDMLHNLISIRRMSFTIWFRYVCVSSFKERVSVNRSKQIWHLPPLNYAIAGDDNLEQSDSFNSWTVTCERNNLFRDVTRCNNKVYASNIDALCSSLSFRPCIMNKGCNNVYISGCVFLPSTISVI